MARSRSFSSDSRPSVRRSRVNKKTSRSRSSSLSESSSTAFSSASATSIRDPGTQAVAEGTIRFKIRSAKQLKKKRSPEQLIGAMPWSVGARYLQDGDDQWLAVHVNCNKDSLSNLWKCTATIDIRLRSGTDPLHDQVRHATAHYDHATTCHQIGDFLKWDQFVAAANGYIQNTKATIEVRIALHQLTGYRPVPSIDFLTPRNEKTVALVIEDSRVFVSVQTLLDSSPVFSRMLVGDFKETNQDEIALPDVQLKEFVKLLNVLGTSLKSIDGSNCEYLLALADRFQIDVIVNKCEQYIISDMSKQSGPQTGPGSPFSAAKKLILAQKYTLAELQNHVLSSLTYAREVTAIVTGPEFKEFGEATKSALLERICQLI